MRPESYVGYDLVVRCEQHLARRPMQDYAGALIHIPFADSNETEIPTTMIHVAARAVAVVITNGGRVLVHCTGGLNRSSLVVAAYFLHLGMAGPAVVALLRVRRSPHALTTRAFEEWVCQKGRA